MHFAVWAPNAKRVSVVGDFNLWDGRKHAMQARGSSGVWELFVPGIGEGAAYKYEIRTQRNDLLLKSDPFAFRMQLRPETASIVADLDGYTWGDEPWMQQRARPPTGAARRSTSTKCTCRAGGMPGIASRRSTAGPRPPST